MNWTYFDGEDVEIQQPINGSVVSSATFDLDAIVVNARMSIGSPLRDPLIQIETCVMCSYGDWVIFRHCDDNTISRTVHLPNVVRGVATLTLRLWDDATESFFGRPAFVLIITDH